MLTGMRRPSELLHDIGRAAPPHETSRVKTCDNSRRGRVMVVVVLVVLVVVVLVMVVVVVVVVVMEVS